VRQAIPLLPTKLPLGLKRAPQYSTHILTMANISRFVLNLMAGGSGRPASLAHGSLCLLLLLPFIVKTAVLAIGMGEDEHPVIQTTLIAQPETWRAPPLLLEAM
jgi:hypothetical protein